MSFDNYALQIAQKCRLAISIAVLKSKPNDMDIDEYIDQIKNTICDKTGDNLDISTCSDDFNIDNADFNIQNETTDHNGGPNDPSLVYNDKYNTNDKVYMSQKKLSNHNDSKQIDDVGERNYNKRNDEIQDFNQCNNAEHIKLKFRHLINDLRGNKGSTNLQSNQVCLSNEDYNVDIDLTQCYDETHSTIHASTKISNAEDIEGQLSQKIFENNQSQQHVSTKRDSSNNLQNDIHNVTNTALHHQNTSKNIERTKMKHAKNEETNEPRAKIAKKIHSAEDLKANISKYVTGINADSNEKAFTKAIPHFDADDNSIHEINNENVNLANNEKIVKNKHVPNFGADHNLQAASHSDLIREANQVNGSKNIQYTIPEYTQNNTYYSQSQIEEILIDSRFIHGKKICNQKTTDGYDPTKDNINDNIQRMELQSQNTYKQAYGFIEDAFSHEVQNMDVDINHTQRQAKANNGIDIQYYRGIENIIENDVVFSQDAQNMNTYKSINEKDSAASDALYKANFKGLNDLDNNITHITDEECTVFDKNTPKTNDNNITKDTTNNKNATNSDEVSINNVDNQNPANNAFDDTETVDEDLTSTQVERIPYKIIEELNKVKIYLSNRKETEYSKDTGYRSLSQSKYSISQPSNVNIDQAATCLFNYIVTCDLTMASQDINDQISEILCQLIDRLHEEENYPSFIEELLNTVNMMLQLIYEEEHYGEDVAFQKDEQIQRILLLSKSSHIQKYTIEKINDLLEKLVDVNTTDSISEIGQISKMENLCYIFHLLQIILKQYIPNSTLSQSQSSQDEKALRKKDISDLWRKKWIPNFKEAENAGSSENRCVLKECSGILNKIIVNFMDGYSLVAFFALKCFNMMQP